MNDRYEYFDLANAVGWFVIAAIVFFDFYNPTANDIVAVSAGLGVINILRQFAPK